MKNMMAQLPPELRASPAEIEDALRKTGEINTDSLVLRDRVSRPKKLRHLLIATPIRSTRKTRPATVSPARLDAADVMSHLPPSLRSTDSQIETLSNRVASLEVNTFIGRGTSAKSREFVHSAATVISRTAPTPPRYPLSRRFDDAAASSGRSTAPDAAGASGSNWAQSSSLFADGESQPRTPVAGGVPPPRAFFLSGGPYSC